MSRHHLKLFPLLFVTLLWFGCAPVEGVSASPPQPTNVTAMHRSGQTFITWSERGDLTGEHYRIYRHYLPINAANLSLARPLFEVAEDSGRFYANRYNVGGGGT